jgi:hypothetical protein
MAGSASEGQPGPAARIGQIADIGTGAQADTRADRRQGDIIGALIIHAESGDEIG